MKKLVILALALAGLECFGQKEQKLQPINPPREDGYNSEWVANFALGTSNLSINYREALVSLVNKKLAEAGKKIKVDSTHILYIIKKYSKDTLMTLPAGFMNLGKTETDRVEFRRNDVPCTGVVRFFRIPGCGFPLYKEDCTNLVQMLPADGFTDQQKDPFEELPNPTTPPTTGPANPVAGNLTSSARDTNCCKVTAANNYYSDQQQTAPCQMTTYWQTGYYCQLPVYYMQSGPRFYGYWRPGYGGFRNYYQRRR
jgi:hypothetical protein